MMMIYSTIRIQKKKTIYYLYLVTISLLFHNIFIKYEKYKFKIKECYYFLIIILNKRINNNLIKL